jgi:hypothetical protein
MVRALGGGVAWVHHLRRLSPSAGAGARNHNPSVAVIARTFCVHEDFSTTKNTMDTKSPCFFVFFEHFVVQITSST